MKSVYGVRRSSIRATRAVVMLTILLGVIVGLPAGLWRVFGRPLPGRVPSWADLQAWLDQVPTFPVQSTTQVLVVLAWVFWGVFTLQIAVQVPGVVQDAVRCARTGCELPVGAHLNLAGRLLAAVAVSLIAARANVATASAAVEVGGVAASAPISVGVTAMTSASIHVVALGETLWGIAGSRLGDPRRWDEVFELNRHRVQADGGVLVDPDLIRVGWTLLLPTAVAPEISQRSVLPPPPPSAATMPTPRVELAPNPPPSAAPQEWVTAAHRPVAVRLPGGGYVSLTLGAGLAAALAAASIRTRAAVRRPRTEEGELAPVLNPAPVTSSETTLLQAAAMLGHVSEADIDPYVDGPVDHAPLPAALAALRAPGALYIGVRDGTPIPLASVSVGGLGLSGPGAESAARAILTSALAAGGFLAGEAAFTVVTTANDLQLLVGRSFQGGVADRLIVCDSFAEAVDVLSDVDGGKCRLLLIGTPGPTGASWDVSREDADVVLLDVEDAATVTTIDAEGNIWATGNAAQSLTRAEAYRLNLDEARALFDRVLAGAGLSAPSSSERTRPPEPRQALEGVTADPQVASGDGPTDPEAGLTVRILGPFQVLAGDRDVTALFRPMTAALIIGLAVNQRGIMRSTLAADLWPDLDPDSRKQRFKSTLSHARTALAEAYGAKADFVVEAKPSTSLALNPELVAVDAWQADLLLESPRLRRAQEPSARIAKLLEAIAVFRGNVAEGHELTGDRIADTAWLGPHRDAWFHRLVDAHQDAADLLRATEPDHAITLLERAAELEPWNTSVTEQIIEIHMEQRQHHAAARRLRILREHLAHLGTEPSPRVVGLVERVVT